MRKAMEAGILGAFARAGGTTSYAGESVGFGLAVEVIESFGCLHTSLTSAEHGDGFVVLAPDSLTVLTLVRKERRLLFLEDSADIDIDVWGKPQGLAAGVDLKEVKLGHTRQCQIGTYG